MNKKTFTVLFMLGATLLNIVLLGGIFLIGVLLTMFLGRNNPNVASIGIIVSFVAAIALSMFLYSKILQWAMVKFDLENKMDPIFSSRRKRK